MNSVFSRRGLLKALAGSLGVILLGQIYSKQALGFLSYGHQYGNWGYGYHGYGHHGYGHHGYGHSGYGHHGYGHHDYYGNDGYGTQYGWLCDEDGLSNCDYLPVEEINDILRRY